MDNTTLFSLLFALLIRWIVSLHPYSGAGNSPMYGDYEAQRHWMEITWNLPVGQWYTNSTENDLHYWGLDYPPLTAYHSYLMGKIAHHINPEWVKLNDSRGFESYHHKLFMRSTVFVSDLIFLSGLYYFWMKQDSKFSSSYLFQSLFIPSLILIDYGHFQYNCISLGLFLWTVICLQRNYDILATVLFCLALNYKQISLYYALPIFFYLLKRCSRQKSLFGIVFKFLALASTVLFIFGLLWMPYLQDIDSTMQVFRRIFPLYRGIYEDKVANFWYCISIIIKVKNIFTESQLALISGFLTLAASLPSCYILFRENTLKHLKFSLFIVSMAFFLFSFHVHEKTILFVNIAIMLTSNLNPFMTFWFSIISTFSLQPLLIKDGLLIPYFALTVIYATICQNSLKHNNQITDQVFFISVSGVVILSVAALVVPAPDRYPHLHSLLNCVYSFLHFAAFYAIFLYEQLSSYNQKSKPRDTFSLHTMTYIRPKMKTN